MTFEHEQRDALRERFAAAPPLPDTILREVIDRLPETSQEGAPRTRPTTGRLQSMFSATKFVVAGVIVALFAGFLLVGVLVQQSAEVAPAAVGSASPEATPSTPFELPAVIPDDIESGILDTPAGTARWVHLTGGHDTRPSLSFGSQVMEWPTGIAIFHPPGFGEGGWMGSSLYAATITQPSRLWTSGNGIDWALEPLPVPADAFDASLSLVDGMYWLVANVWSGDRVWRSADGVTWEEFDPSGLAPPGPSGLEWHLAYSPPATAGDLTLILRSGSGAIPSDFLGGTSECRDDMRELAAGVYQTIGNEDETCPTLRFEETETGLQVADDATGEDLGMIIGADLGHIEQMRGIEFEGETQILIVGDGEATPVEVPWPAETYPDVALYGVEDGVYAYVSDNCCDEVTVWHTTDGHSWDELGPPSFLEGAPARGFMSYAALPSSLAVSVFDSGSLVAWETIDGIDWSPAPEGRPDGTYPVRLESGWFANDGGRFGDPDEGGDELWMYVGDTWVSLAELGMEQSAEHCVVGKEAVGNTTLFEGVFRCLPSRTPSADGLWILTLDSSD